MSSSFAYQSLRAFGPGPTFRLLRLHPGPWNSPIEMTLSTYRLNYDNTEDESEAGANTRSPKQDLELAPPYEALSYEWGDHEGKKYEISVNGHPFSSNVEEKNDQVRMMHLFYHRAERVRIWIEYYKDLLSDVFPFIRNDPALGTRKYGTFRKGPASRIFCEHPETDMSMPELAELCEWMERFDVPLRTLSNPDWWDAVGAIVTKSYWERMWIVQEYLRARDIVICCGREAVSNSHLDVILQAIDIFDHDRKGRCLCFGCYANWMNGIDGVNKLGKIGSTTTSQDERQVFGLDKFLQDMSFTRPFIEGRRSWLPNVNRHLRSIHSSLGFSVISSRRGKRSSNLYDLMWATENSKCADPHDRIYSILGLSNEFNDPRNPHFRNIPIDYQRPMRQVKVAVLKAYLQSGQFDKQKFPLVRKGVNKDASHTTQHVSGNEIAKPEAISHAVPLLPLLIAYQEALQMHTPHKRRPTPSHNVRRCNTVELAICKHAEHSGPFTAEVFARIGNIHGDLQRGVARVHMQANSS
ncbi:hypothetical protein M011DRAFT_455181 [Sporormia fimetaria CBS 119925]|uniref:Uncharacterized protein n=1 Tax=Sporormia fimetaria CBS 119925 TaxID=1340428 RepID=A0A6A6VKI5_9PLEO|nr:hypothetical protein M011DRAFT_455181 [Sporormia fimetaria CBS 119925]